MESGVSCTSPGMKKRTYTESTEDTETTEKRKRNDGEENQSADRQTGAGWPRPRRKNNRPGLARCRHGSRLHRLAPDPGNDRLRRRAGRRRRHRSLDPLRRPQHYLPPADEAPPRQRHERRHRPRRRHHPRSRYSRPEKIRHRRNLPPRNLHARHRGIHPQARRALLTPLYGVMMMLDFGVGTRLRWRTKGRKHPSPNSTLLSNNAKLSNHLVQATSETCPQRQSETEPIPIIS